MTERRDFLKHCAALSLLAALVLRAPGSTAQSGRAAPQAHELAVIVAKDSRVDSISMAELKRIFTSERLSDPAGNRYVPLNHPAKTDTRVAFDLAVLKMDPEQVGRFWIDRKIRGGAGAPRSVDSAVTLRRVVSRLPGGIGYLRATQLSPEVKAIRVDGKLPGDAGYPIIVR